MEGSPKVMLAIVLLLLAGCSDGLGINGDPGSLDRMGTAVEPCDMDPISAYDFEGVAIDGDSILISVAYGGGCETHHFRLCWDGAFMESDPVQVNLDLIHDAHGDACMAYVMETHRFSLAPLEEAWIEAYGTDTGLIVINIDGSSVPYAF